MESRTRGISARYAYCANTSYISISHVIASCCILYLHIISYHDIALLYLQASCKCLTRDWLMTGSCQVTSSCQVMHTPCAHRGSRRGESKRLVVVALNPEYRQQTCLTCFSLEEKEERKGGREVRREEERRSRSTRTRIRIKEGKG